MLLRNRTGREIGLARTAVSDELWVATVVVASHFRIGEAGLLPLAEDPPRKETWPPDLSRLPLWQGTSVTASGVAAGPAAPPFVRPVSLRVGDELRRLIVFGERRWRRGAGGALTASEAAPFEAIPLSFRRAFGGGYDAPPGLLPGTELPVPALRVDYPLNPSGVGFHESEQAAEGQLLPSIELPDQLVQRWSDRPEPGGFTPCPELPALRLPSDPAFAEAMQAAGGWPPGPGLSEEQRRRAVDLHMRLAMRVLHHAPGRLIFPSVKPGVAVALEGLGPDARALRFEVPPSPIRVGIRRGGQPEEIPFAVRSVHVDADEGIASFVHAHSFHHHPARAPEWVRVAPRGAA